MCMTEMFIRRTIIAAFAARQFDDSPFVWYAVMRERGEGAVTAEEPNPLGGEEGERGHE